MRVVILAILFITFSGCRESQQKMAVSAPLKDTATKLSDSNPAADISQNDIDTAISHIDSAKVKGQTYIAFNKGSISYVANAKRDTILKLSEGVFNVAFEDFNGDGHKDIRVTYITNVPGIQDLLLFDANKNMFQLVEGFSEFPNSNPVKGSKYYYSYHRSGCSDLNWDSDLFYIKSYKAIRIGNIAGYECNDREVKDGIYIYKIRGESETLVKKMPIKTIYDYEEHKWGFIEEYWRKNYKKFL